MSAFETSKKFYPYCCKEAVANLKILPFEVIGTPLFVIILPVLSIVVCFDPAREPAVVPTL
jgi:hypothetical protein